MCTGTSPAILGWDKYISEDQANVLVIKADDVPKLLDSSSYSFVVERLKKKSIFLLIWKAAIHSYDNYAAYLGSLTGKSQTVAILKCHHRATHHESTYELFLLLGSEGTNHMEYLHDSTCSNVCDVVKLACGGPDDNGNCTVKSVGVLSFGSGLPLDDRDLMQVVETFTSVPISIVTMGEAKALLPTQIFAELIAHDLCYSMSDVLNSLRSHYSLGRVEKGYRWLFVMMWSCKETRDEAIELANSGKHIPYAESLALKLAGYSFCDEKSVAAILRNARHDDKKTWSADDYYSAFNAILMEKYNFELKLGISSKWMMTMTGKDRACQFLSFPSSSSSSTVRHIPAIILGYGDSFNLNDKIAIVCQEKCKPGQLEEYKFLMEHAAAVIILSKNRNHKLFYDSFVGKDCVEDGQLGLFNKFHQIIVKYGDDENDVNKMGLFYAPVETSAFDWQLFDNQRIEPVLQKIHPRFEFVECFFI